MFRNYLATNLYLAETQSLQCSAHNAWRVQRLLVWWSRGAQHFIDEEL